MGKGKNPRVVQVDMFDLATKMAHDEVKREWLLSEQPLYVTKNDITVGFTPAADQAFKTYRERYLNIIKDTNEVINSLDTLIIYKLTHKDTIMYGTHKECKNYIEKVDGYKEKVPLENQLEYLRISMEKVYSYGN